MFSIKRERPTQKPAARPRAPARNPAKSTAHEISNMAEDGDAEDDLQELHNDIFNESQATEESVGKKTWTQNKTIIMVGLVIIVLAVFLIYTMTKKDDDEKQKMVGRRPDYGTSYNAMPPHMGPPHMGPAGGNESAAQAQAYAMAQAQQAAHMQAQAQHAAHMQAQAQHVAGSANAAGSQTTQAHPLPQVAQAQLLAQAQAHQVAQAAQAQQVAHMQDQAAQRARGEEKKSDMRAIIEKTQAANKVDSLDAHIVSSRLANKSDDDNVTFSDENDLFADSSKGTQGDARKRNATHGVRGDDIDVIASIVRNRKDDADDEDGYEDE